MCMSLFSAFFKYLHCTLLQMTLHIDAEQYTLILMISFCKFLHCTRLLAMRPSSGTFLFLSRRFATTILQSWLRIGCVLLSYEIASIGYWFLKFNHIQQNCTLFRYLLSTVQIWAKLITHYRNVFNLGHADYAYFFIMSFFESHAFRYSMASNT